MTRPNKNYLVLEDGGRIKTGSCLLLEDQEVVWTNPPNYIFLPIVFGVLVQNEPMTRRAFIKLTASIFGGLIIKT